MVTKTIFDMFLTRAQADPFWEITDTNSGYKGVQAEMAEE